MLKNKTKAKTDQLSYIEEIQCSKSGKWRCYDVLLATQCYGWEAMKKWVDYIAKVDFITIYQIHSSNDGSSQENIADSYIENGTNCDKTPELEIERGTLSVAGFSKLLKAPVKLVLYNQTRMIKVYTPCDDDEAVKEYIEAAASKSFEIIFERKKATTTKHYKKFLLSAKFFLTCIILSSVLFIISMFLIGKFLNIIGFLAIAFLVWLFIFSLVMYKTKYAWTLSCNKLLKDKKINDFVEDIDVTEDSCVCLGKYAFLSKKTRVIIPYSEILWVHPHIKEVDHVVIYLTNGKKVNLWVAQTFNYFAFMNKLKTMNPEIYEGLNEDEFYSDHPELSEKSHLSKIIPGICLMIFAVFIFIMGIKNKSINGIACFYFSLIFIAGLLLSLSKYHKKIKENINKILSKIRESRITDIISKIAFPASFISLTFIFISAKIESNTLLVIAFTTYSISVIPFLGSILFGFGDYKKKKPVTITKNKIYISSIAYTEWRKLNRYANEYTLNKIIPIKTKEPIIKLYDDNKKTREFRLQTENDEDFTGKYFHICIRLSIFNRLGIPVAQIDGFISDSKEEHSMTSKDIGYRMEGYFLRCGKKPAIEAYEGMKGLDLPAKGLKYPGYTTPSNVRLVGICPDCKKSFAFHGYAYYMTNNDVAYSDDGLDCCVINSSDINKDTWIYETDGKVFRYYNSFNCPHCGTPYIDYKNNKDSKVHGVSGCVHLGRKAYNEK